MQQPFESRRSICQLRANAVPEISGALNVVLADMFALYLKTKNFHWHVSGPHFRDYHLLLDEQSKQIFATTDDIAGILPNSGHETKPYLRNAAVTRGPSSRRCR
jgi:starvation-inducible DNA-binding protein